MSYRNLRPAGEGRADDLVDDYLAERFGIGLEAVLLDAIEQRPTAATAGTVSVTIESGSRSPHYDGGLSESFIGSVEVAGMSYSFHAETYSVPDAYVRRFLVNLWRFEPMEWQAVAQLSERA